MNKIDLSSFKIVAPVFVELIDRMRKRDSMFLVTPSIQQCIFAFYACNPLAFQRRIPIIENEISWEHVRLYLDYAERLSYATHEFREISSADGPRRIGAEVTIRVWPIIAEAFREVLILPPNSKLSPENLYRKLSGQRRNMAGVALAYGLTEFLRVVNHKCARTSPRP